MNSVENKRRKRTAAICRSSSSIAALWTELKRYVTLVSTGRLLYKSCKSMNIHTKVMRGNTIPLLHDSETNVVVISLRKHCTSAINNSSCFMTIHEVNATVYSHFRTLWHRNGWCTNKWSFTYYVSCGLTSACCLTLLSVLNKVSKTCSISSRLPAIFLGKTTHCRLLRRAKATQWTTLFAPIFRALSSSIANTCANRTR